MSIPFGRIISETFQVAEGEGVADLCRLNEAMAYWAPEVKESWFWYGHGGVLGYLDILNNNFGENKRVRNIYTGFLEEYYKNNNVQV